MTDNFTPYSAGDKLYGEDFSYEQIEQWYEKEKEGYGDLVKPRAQTYTYWYHALNKFHAFRHISLPKDSQALAIGGAFCHELLPVVSKLSHISNLDPSQLFDADMLSGVPIEHVQPNISGEMPFRDSQFDLITSFGVLHHIPNVSFVLQECFRCLKPGGTFLVREPIVSMGDWRKPRKGLTENERGIPAAIFVHLAQEAGFSIVKKSYCDFSPLVRFSARMGWKVFSSPVLTKLDYLLSLIFRFNIRYHRVNALQKFAPASMVMVLQKRHP